jgi:hypothetical protein
MGTFLMGLIFYFYGGDEGFWSILKTDDSGSGHLWAIPLPKTWCLA